MQVSFVGEWAVDARREFFRLFAQEAQNRLLVGPSVGKFFTSNMCALQVCWAAQVQSKDWVHNHS